VNFKNLAVIFFSFQLIIFISACSHVSLDVPQTKIPENLQYWDLSTGSKIAYVYFKGKEPRKPYPIIFLHGGPGSHVTSTTIKVLSKLTDDGYDIYFYDQVGCGESERLKNIREYTVERHVKDLEAIIDKIGAEKVILIAHSWGATLAPIYVAKHPDKIEKLIFSGPGGILPKDYINLRTISAPDSIKLKRNYKKKYEPLSYLDKKSLRRKYHIEFFADRFGIKIASDKEFDGLLDIWMKNMNKNNPCDSTLLDTINYEGGSGGYCNVRTAKRFYKKTEENTSEKLKNCKIPLLILLGECDNLPWTCVNDYLQVFKNTKLVIIPNSGHTVYSYQPELTLKLIRDFLQEK
jgi:proline iminopeptidase